MGVGVGVLVLLLHPARAIEIAAPAMMRDLLIKVPCPPFEGTYVPMRGVDRRARNIFQPVLRATRSR
jgi:hypothetical protein